MPPLIRKNCGSGVTVTYIANTGYLILELDQFLTNQVVSKSSCPVPTSWLSTTQRISGWRRQPPHHLWWRILSRVPSFPRWDLSVHQTWVSGPFLCCQKLLCQNKSGPARGSIQELLLLKLREKKYIWYYQAFRNQQTINKCNKMKKKNFDESDSEKFNAPKWGEVGSKLKPRIIFFLNALYSLISFEA